MKNEFPSYHEKFMVIFRFPGLAAILKTVRLVFRNGKFFSGPYKLTMRNKEIHCHYAIFKYFI